jgi:hypothetical protein
MTIQVIENSDDTSPLLVLSALNADLDLSGIAELRHAKGIALMMPRVMVPA